MAQATQIAICKFSSEFYEVKNIGQKSELRLIGIGSSVDKYVLVDEFMDDYILFESKISAFFALKETIEAVLRRQAMFVKNSHIDCHEFEARLNIACFCAKKLIAINDMIASITPVAAHKLPDDEKATDLLIAALSDLHFFKKK